MDPFLEDSLTHSYPVELWSHVRQSKSKLNAAEKIKKWMKNRKKKVRKSFPLLKSNQSNTNLSSFPSASSDLEYKEVFIEVEPTTFTSDYKLSFSENMLNLKIGLLEENYSACDKLCILDIIPGKDLTDVRIGKL